MRVVVARGPAPGAAAPAHRRSPPVATGVSNAALARALLAREPAKPGEPGHEGEWKAFVEALMLEVNKAGDVETAQALTDWRAKLDVAVEGTTTLTVGKRQLVVDRRNLTSILTRLRWRAMDRINDARTAKKTALDAATTPEARDKVRAELMTAVRPYIDFLQGPVNDPASKADRFSHWNPVIQDSVLVVLQQRIVDEARGTGLNADGSGKPRGDLDAQLEDIGKKDAWCGAFAALAFKLAGVTSGKGQLIGEGGILSFFNYADPESKSRFIMDGGERIPLEEYHDWRRHSRRSIQVVANRPGAAGGFSSPGAKVVQAEDLDVRPGDILLLDNTGGNRPDHVMIATDYDAAAHKTSKIAGNEVDNPGRVATGTGFDVASQPGAIPADKHNLYVRKKALLDDKKKRALSDAEAKELEKVEQDIAEFEKSPAFFAGGKKVSRIAAVCRLSIVDFETHDYVK